MLNTLDIALLMDSRTVDGAGNVITLDRSRHGIHCQYGDGVTAAVMPAFDALNGRVTFDGGDYMQIPASYDVAGILAGMGAIQDETYIFYLDPIVVNSTFQYFIGWNTGVGTSRFLIRIDNTNVITMYVNNPAGDLETFSSASILALNGRGVLVTMVRDPAHGTQKQRLFVNAVLHSTGNSVSRDGRNTLAKYIGQDSGSGFQLQNGTGLRFFGYARRVFTETELRAIQKYLRGVL